MSMWGQNNKLDKELSQGLDDTSQSNHTRTTALSNSMKLSHASGVTQDGQVMVETSDKMWSNGEGMANPFSILALRTP